MTERVPMGCAQMIEHRPIVDLLGANGRLRPIKEIQRDIYRSALPLVGGNMSRLARELGVNRSTVYRNIDYVDRAVSRVDRPR